MSEIIEVSGDPGLIVIDGDGQVVEIDEVQIEVIEVAKQGLPGPPGSAENVAEIVPSPVLSFENALL